MSEPGGLTEVGVVDLPDWMEKIKVEAGVGSVWLQLTDDNLNALEQKLIAMDVAEAQVLHDLIGRAMAVADPSTFRQRNLEVVLDVLERARKASTELEQLKPFALDANEHARLGGKIEGVGLIIGYLEESLRNA